MRAALTLAILASVSGTAWADGGLIPIFGNVSQTEAAQSGVVSSDGQRAVLWRTSADVWELYIDPGQSSLEQVAWVLPLPVVPEVESFDAAFIDELDAATMPVFINKILRYEVIGYDHSGGGCFFGGADGGRAEYETDASDIEQRMGAARPPVQVWGSGELGSLSYEILSSSSGAALESWLSANGYVVPEQLDELTQDYVERGYFFFVAKFLRSTGQSQELPALRFRMRGLSSPEYPMLLTRLSVAERFRFTLWIVDGISVNSLFVPSEQQFVLLERVFPETEQYHSEVSDDFDMAQVYEDRVEAEGELGKLVLQYNARLEPVGLNQRVELLRPVVKGYPLPVVESDWHPLLRTILDQRLLVSRYHGALLWWSMNDIVLREEPQTFELLEEGYFERTIHVKAESWAMGPKRDSGERALLGTLLLLFPAALGLRRGRGRQQTEVRR